MVSSEHKQQLSDAAKSEGTYKSFKQYIRSLDQSDYYKDEMTSDLDNERTSVINSQEPTGKKLREWVYVVLFSLYLGSFCYYEIQSLEIQQNILNYATDLEDYRNDKNN